MVETNGGFPSTKWNLWGKGSPGKSIQLTNVYPLWKVVPPRTNRIGEPRVKRRWEQVYRGWVRGNRVGCVPVTIKDCEKSGGKPGAGGGESARGQQKRSRVWLQNC